MPTIHAQGVANRLEVGDAVISAGKSVDTKPIQKRWLEFARAHREFAAAQKLVSAIADKIARVQHRVAEFDVDQDECVESLANALAGAGESRSNPFKSFGFEAPSVIKSMGDIAETRTVIKLAAAVKKRKGLPPAVLAAASRCEKAAAAVIAAAKPLEALTRELRDALARRAPLEQKWANAFAATKRAARSAADDGASTLYDTIFVRVERPAKAKGKPKPAIATPQATPS